RRVWSADQDDLSFLGRRRRRYALPARGAICRPAARSDHHRREPDWRRRADWHQVGQECQPRRNLDPGDHRPNHVSVANGGDRTELRSGQGFCARFEFGVVTGPAVDAKDFKQFVAWLKANPGKATFGVPSNGTIPHFTGSKLEQVLGIPLTRVAYRGSAPAINDLIGGHLPFAIVTIADAIPQHRAGNVKILAVSSAERSPFLPDVPTLRENGIDLVADGWYGMWLPAGSPRDFARQLSAAVVTSLAKPDVRKKLSAIGLIPVGTTPEGLTQELAADTALWRPIVKATGYKITY